MIRFLSYFLLASIVSSAAVAADGNWNIRFLPLPPIPETSLGEVSLDYRINDNFTVGPFVRHYYFKYLRSTSQTTNVGLAATYFDRGVFNDGFYAGLGIAISKYEASYRTYAEKTFSASDNGNTIIASAGYAWFWESFNITLGVKAGSVPKSFDIKDDTGTVVDRNDPMPATGIDFKIGWVF